MGYHSSRVVGMLACTGLLPSFSSRCTGSVLLWFLPLLPLTPWLSEHPSCSAGLFFRCCFFPFLLLFFLSLDLSMGLDSIDVALLCCFPRLLYWLHCYSQHRTLVITPWHAPHGRTPWQVARIPEIQKPFTVDESRALGQKDQKRFDLVFDKRLERLHAANKA